jgi:hypothetical protein
VLAYTATGGHAKVHHAGGAITPVRVGESHDRLVRGGEPWFHRADTARAALSPTDALRASLAAGRGGRDRRGTVGHAEAGRAVRGGETRRPTPGVHAAMPRLQDRRACGWLAVTARPRWRYVLSKRADARSVAGKTKENE